MSKGTLANERAEAKKRVAALKEQTKLEQLQKDEFNLERECHKHTSILEWLVGLFKKRR